MGRWSEYPVNLAPKADDEIMILDKNKNSNRRITLQTLIKLLDSFLVEVDAALKTEGMAADAKIVGEKFEEVTVNDTRLEKKIDEVSKNIGGSLNIDDVRNAVNEYLEENPDMVTPDNIVLFEEDENNQAFTIDTLMAEVLKRLELKAVDEQTLGLYMGEKLINSVKLEEFKVSEIICTGLTIVPSHTTAYGKATLELIATATPQDCTQKVRWFTTDELLATVSDGTVSTTGKKGTVTIYAVCGNYRAECEIEITAYVYPELNFQIGQVLESTGAAYTRTEDPQNMRIASDYIKTPIDTKITMNAGNNYLYQLYKYKDDKLASWTTWINCAGIIEITASECSGVVLKIRKSNYGEWTESEITAFSQTVTVESA